MAAYNHPKTYWLELVWRYLRKNFATTEELCRFQGLPLIPLDMSQVPVLLTRLELPSKIVVRSLHGDCLDEILTNVLKELGLIIMEEYPVFLSSHPAITNTFVHPPSPQGVLKSLMASRSEKKSDMYSVTNEGKCFLRKFVSRVPLLEQEEKTLLSRLPLFETQAKSFVSKKSGLCAAPESSFPVASRRDFIDVTQEDSKRLAGLLGIRILTPTDFLFEEAFPNVKRGNYSSEEIGRLMAFVIERYQVFAGSDTRFEEEMKFLPFVSTLGGRFRAMDVFDPRNDLLQGIFAEEDVFPTGAQYTNPGVLVVLDKLGLKNEDKITGQDLYQSAKKVANVVKTSTAEKKSEAIMAYLNRNPMKLQENISGTALGLLLQDIPWVSGLKQRPHGFPRSLHFVGESDKERHIYKPSEVESEDKANLIGAVKPIVKVDSSCQLAKQLGWDRMPGVVDVVDQLKSVISCYAQDEKPQYITIVKEIYSFLSGATDAFEVKQALKRDDNLSWIWNGDSFSSPDVVLAQRPSIDLSPYICFLPSEVVHFSDFFSEFGVRKQCDPLFLLQVLHMIQQKYDVGCGFSPLEVKKDLQLSVDILNEVKPSVGEQLPAELQEKVLIPTYVKGDSCIKLVPTKDCVYCEHEWLERDENDEDLSLSYVHPNIPNSTAELLLVRSMTDRMLEPDEMEIGDEFGQEEKLTSRLNRLLEDYTDGFAVPKELVQNADDAGATEVRFLYDERANEDALTCLFEDGMKACQGPALWVYNDAEFRDEDFANITKLNGGTKELHTEKIGKFGLGFNVVYNLTDVPMFLSRNYFVIFDPNTFYLGKAIRNKNKPGIKININKNTNRLRNFRNQFKPFNGIFGCDLHLNKEDNSYQGTLFRFPLRTKEQALRSEIKQFYYDHKQVLELLEIFIGGARNLLLFTQNVRRVSIFHLPKGSNEQTQPLLLFEVTKSLSSTGIKREVPFPVTLPPALKNLSKDGKDLLKQCNFLRASSQIATNVGEARQLGTDLLRSAVTINIKSTNTECGSLFFEGKDHLQSGSEIWLVAFSMGKGQAMQFSESDKSLLPSAGVAVQLMPKENGKFVPAPIVQQTTGNESHHNGTVFCYLPLPIHSGLPIHINAAFAVHSNRRHLKQKTEDDKVCIGVEWNNVLLEDSVCAAYLDLLEDVKLAPETYPFHLLWPRACDVRPHCEPLARAFYHHVASGNNCPFSDGNRWVDIDQVVFLEPSFRQEDQIGNISFAVLKMLIKGNKAVVDLPANVFESFVNYGLGEKIYCKLYNKDKFFRELFFPNIASVPSELRDKLILYILDDANRGFYELVKTYPCIPASPGGQTLKCPHQLVNPYKAAASLFRSEDEKFPVGNEQTFLNPLLLAKLEDLGMMADDPPWTVFAERAESIVVLNHESNEAALKRTKALIDLLTRKLTSSKIVSVPEGILDILLEAKFLPVATKPKIFPLSWKGDDLRREENNMFVSPKEAFPKSKKYLVCCSEPLVDLFMPSIVQTFFLLDKKQLTITHAITQIHAASSTNLDSLNSLEFEEVRKVCFEAYKYLQNGLENNTIGKEQVRKIFEKKKLILTEKEFVDVNHVAFDLLVDCYPYLQKLSGDIARSFHSLMKTAGVKEVFDSKDFINSLKKIKDTFGDKVLDRNTLQIAVHIAGQLAKCLKGSAVGVDSVEERQDVIYLPDFQGIMRLASELCMKDCYWLPGEFDVVYVNSLIPPPTSIKLGVKTRREEVLQRFSVGIPFGQKEKLTTRLHRLVSEYSYKEDILKELLQNADDAEATEICFIKDPRKHHDERVFEDSWKRLQGPALCVYNNKPFTTADIEGIQNLGEGSKGNDPNKTGQYGVGFNAVYHLTDVPSFVSYGDEIGDVLCVFDPHCKYAPGANRREPGRMFKETSKLRCMFPDVFSCYIEDHFPTQNSTMFRFPLRTQEMAEHSKISKSSITLEELDEMMELLKEELFEILLFVNSVRKITLCDIDESGKVGKSYFIEAKMSDEDSSRRQQFATYVKQAGKSGKGNGDVLPIDVEVKKCSYVLNLRDSTGHEENWLIVQQIGFDKKVETSVVNAYQRQDLGMLPRGGVACPLQTPKVETNQSKRKKKKAYCFLPLPVETGLPVHINGHFALDHESRRGLWPYKADHYGSKWNEALLKDVIASCYLALLDQMRNCHQLPVTQDEEEATIYCSRRTLLNNVAEYEKNFPLVVSSNPYWTTLVTSVYQEIDRKRLRLFPVVRDKTGDDSKTRYNLTWFPPTGDGKDKAFFVNFGTAAPQPPLDVEAKRGRIGQTDFQQVLHQTGFNLVAFSGPVFMALEKSNVKSCCLSPSAVMDFFKSFGHEDSLCKIGPIPVDVKETQLKNAQTVEIILKYCRDDKEFLKNLPGLPLLLTQDNYLHTFKAEDPKFLSRHYNILPQCEGMFVHKHIRTHIFGDSESLRASVFKPFDVKSLAENLHRTLPLTYCNSSDGYVKWCPKQEGAPNHDWVYNVWNFLSEEINDVLREIEANDEEESKSIQAPKENYREMSRKNQEAKTSEEEKARIIGALEPLNDWCILPCTETINASNAPDGEPCRLKMEHFLVPLRLAETVIDFHGATSGQLVETLKKLSLIELNSTVLPRTSLFSYLSGDSRNLARKLVGSLKTPASLLKCFKQKITRNPRSLEGMLTASECDTILQYFSDNVSRLLKSEKSTLRQLPFYEATHDGLIDVKNHRVCVVSDAFPREEMHVLESEANVIFLKSKIWLSPLFEFLAFEFPSAADVYCEFVLRYFGLLSEEARLMHLEYIRRLVLYSKSTEAIDKQGRLIDCLKDTEIISSKNGVLRKASCYYDPENKVFKTMLPEDKFPPRPFNLPRWLEFLKTIGLIHEVSQDLFKTFALDVAREGATHATCKTYEKSKVLVAHLFTRDEVVESCLLEAICNIKFVATDPLSPELCAVCRHFDCTPYIAFEGSVLAKHSKIVWTTATLLPIWANPRKNRGEDRNDCNDILSHLHVAEPTVEMVIFHCQNVCLQFGKENFNEVSSEQLTVRISVMENIYEFLQSKAISSPTAKKLLKDTSCVMVEQGRRFVKPEQVVIEIYKGNEIEPFLYGMPAELGQFKTLFQYLGCSRCVTLNHYSMILDMLQRKWNENSLDPNERRRALKAVKGLFEVLQDHPAGINGLSSLYLPAVCPFGSSQGDTTPRVVLRKAAELLFDDARHYHKRIQNFKQFFLVDLKTAGVRCNLSGNFKDLVMLLPTVLRPQMLSCVLKEKFVNSPDNTERFDVGAASSLKKQLYSEQFCRGIIRLIRHTSHENEVKVDEGVVSSIESRLQSIQFHGMGNIVTHLVYKDNVIPGSKSKLPFFLERTCQTGQEIWNVYVSAVEDVEQTISAIALTLSRVIAEACGGLLRETAMYIPEMLHCQLGSIDSLLDTMKIRQDDTCDAGRRNVFPLPGSFIPIAEHHLLNPAFNYFKPGEYVGYELEDPSMELEEGDATFIYAVITKEVSTGDVGLLARLYEINIGDDKKPTEAQATELYKFYLPQEIALTAVVTSQRQGNAHSPNERKAIFEEISKILEEAWRLPEDRRKKVIKRLIFRWHPDKNPGNEDFCTEVFQHIKNEIELLERDGAGRSQYRCSETYDDFFGFCGERARRDTSQRQEYRDTYYRYYGSWDEGTWTWEVPPSFSTTNPQPQQARRWFRQAEADLAAVMNDTNTLKPSYEWACFKCHQVSVQEFSMHFRRFLAIGCDRLSNLEERQPEMC